MYTNTQARFENLLASSNRNYMPTSERLGRHIRIKKKLISKYRKKEISIEDIYNYYRTPLSTYAGNKIRNIFVTSSLCLTIYLACNIYRFKEVKMPRIGKDFASLILIAGIIFVFKELVAFMLRFKKMLYICYFYKYIFKINNESIKISKVVKKLIKLEKNIHGNNLTTEGIKYAINLENRRISVLISKFPTIFTPMCSNFFLYILKFYIEKINQNNYNELSDEIRVISVSIFILSPIISMFFVLYYIVKTIENFQNDGLYVIKKVYKPKFKYLIKKNNEYPHELQKRIKKSTKYLNNYLLAGKKDYMVGLFSAISFFLSCLIFVIIYAMVTVVFVNKPTVSTILYQELELFGKKTNVLYLSYFIGFLSCCLRCLRFDFAVGKRKKALEKWCHIMQQQKLLKYSKNRKYILRIISKFFVPQLQMFLIEIFSPFVVPFQLMKLRKELKNINDFFDDHSYIFDENEAFSVIDL